MEQGMEMLFALFGGLAMFLYGMDRMSRALQRAAGDAMKRLLARLTATPLLGVLTGLAVTAVLQSSSAATVMVIGFVSAGLLELPRAVAVIYGINIGTTMTAQLIAFDVQTLVYPVLFLGFLLDFAARRPRWQAVGEAVFSFGLLFEGIDILGRALQPLAGQAVFLDWMTRVKESPLLGILLGLSMTMVVQSSSATIALLQNVARQAGPDGIHSVLGLAGAVPVLLGDNIGTTVTALLACIGQGKDAARAALAHSCFNLSGSLLAAVLLPWFVRLVELISPKGPELEIISRQIANAHTAFNVCCALLWLPFLPWMVRLVCALVPEKRKIRKAPLPVRVWGAFCVPGKECLHPTSQSASQTRPGCGTQHPQRFACALLAAAPTATPCFRHWRRSSLLPLVGEPLAKG
mgnify:CR=1 FL=1